MTTDPYDGQGELIFDMALDAAAERIANVQECSCDRCREAELQVRLELIEEGRRRAEDVVFPLASSAPTGEPSND